MNDYDHRSRGGRPAAIALGVMIALVTAGCGEQVRPSGLPSSAPSAPQATAVSPSAPNASASRPPARTIPQPAPPSDLALAPESARVDLAMPTFSDPTRITNPLFPVSAQRSVLLLGEVDGHAFRTEVTLLPETRIISWDGHNIETLVSQYVAHLDGRIHEVAYDFYAQADDGSVWYFGEEVYNFADGAIVDTHGTWIAGKDAPAAMIMPADPKVGDVYRPENAPGLVFEEVVVKSVDQQLDGPFGPIQGGLLITELHMDGVTEEKSFAPGYGEFFTGGGADLEALAMAIPTDAASGPVPTDISALASGSIAVLEAARAGNWIAASSATAAVKSAWSTHATGDVPRLIEPRLDAAVAALASAVEARDAARAGQAAIDTARLAFDLQLRHRSQIEIDIVRFDLWAAQIVLDAAADEPSLVAGDVFALDYVRDRIRQSLTTADATEVNLAMEELNGAVADRDVVAAAEIATRLRETITRISPRT